MQRLVILAVCSFVAAGFINFAEKTVYPLVLREEIRVVPTKEIVELMCLDHRGFASDFLFMKVNLHTGSLMWKPLKFQFDSRWCYSTMDLITDLDPKYFSAYLFSAMGLIHNFDDVKLARPIVEKGMQTLPQRWELPFWIGYDYYVYFNDYEVGGEYLWQAIQKPDAPKNFLAMLLTVLKKGGFYERALWAMEAMLDQTKDERLKAIYAKKLKQLQNLALLQRAVQRYHEQKGRLPHDFRALIKEKMINNIPEDPFGMHYVLDTAQAKVILANTNHYAGE